MSGGIPGKRRTTATKIAVKITNFTNGLTNNVTSPILASVFRADDFDLHVSMRMLDFPQHCEPLHRAAHGKLLGR